MSIYPQDILFYLGGAGFGRYAAASRRIATIGRRGEEGKETWTRSGTNALQRTRSGLYIAAAANVPRVEMLDLDGDGVFETPSLIAEQAATNVVLRNRDLTNAAWTKTNVSAVKNITGLDGVANSASRITASAGNGTCLQAITLASSSRMQSAFVKRLTGSGVIQMTTDNGSHYDAVTVTSSWTRVQCLPQTLANPTVGFRIVTSGDAIAVDYVQNEEQAFCITNPIATAGTAQSRSADAHSFPYYGPAAPLAIYLKVLSHGTFLHQYMELLKLGFNAPTFIICGSGSVYQALWGEADSSLHDAFAAEAPARGEIIELLVTIASTGVQVQQSRNGAAATTGTSVPIVVPSSWAEPASSATVALGHPLGGSFNGFDPIIAAIGARSQGSIFPSMADFRAWLPTFS